MNHRNQRWMFLANKLHLRQPCANADLRRVFGKYSVTKEDERHPHRECTKW